MLEYTPLQMGSRTVGETSTPIYTYGRTSWAFSVATVVAGAALSVVIEFQGSSPDGPWTTAATLTPAEAGVVSAAYPDATIPAWASALRARVATATPDSGGDAPMAQVTASARWFDVADTADKGRLLSEVQGYDQLANVARKAEVATQALALSENPFRFFGGNVAGQSAGSMGGRSYPANVMQPQPMGGFGAGYGDGVFGPYGSTAVPLVDNVDPKLAEWMGGVAVEPLLDVNFGIPGFLDFIKDKIATQTEYMYQTILLQRDPSPGNIVSLRQRPPLAPGLADGFNKWKNMAGKGWKGRG